MERWFTGGESISRFLYMAGGKSAQREDWSRQGYDMDWKKGEMNYSAIADITVEELEQFRDLYEM